MKFEEVLPALREGRKITNRIIRLSGYKYIYYKDGAIFEDKGGYWHLSSGEIIDNGNWEIIKEKKKVKLRDLTEEQLKKWRQTNCIDGVCKNCVFNSNTGCICHVVYYWIKNKPVFSDTFLNQEIEIEEE